MYMHLTKIQISAYVNINIRFNFHFILYDEVYFENYEELMHIMSKFLKNVLSLLCRLLKEVQLP